MGDEGDRIERRQIRKDRGKDGGRERFLTNNRFQIDRTHAIAHTLGSIFPELILLLVPELFKVAEVGLLDIDTVDWDLIRFLQLKTWNKIKWNVKIDLFQHITCMSHVLQGRVRSDLENYESCACRAE